jgi:dethiobiotin synthetase
MKTFYITGIDTEIGKTVVTGKISAYLNRKGIKTTTMKPVQTGCTGIAEDILTHREIMGVEADSLDKEHVTNPVVLKFPASPHLAAELEDSSIDFELIDRSLETLKENFDCVLIEGAGGIYVPLTRNYTSLDFVKEKNFPVIIVSSPRLGSINHTMLTIEILKNSGVEISGLVYNMFPPERDEITRDSIGVIKHFSKKLGLNFPFFINPYSEKLTDEVDFKGLI